MYKRENKKKYENETVMAFKHRLENQNRYGYQPIACSI